MTLSVSGRSAFDGPCYLYFQRLGEIDSELEVSLGQVCGEVGFNKGIPTKVQALTHYLFFS